MTRITQTLLIIPLGLSALACELSNKNLSDATADDTGAPGTTAGEGGATTGVNMAAPDTLEPETAGETGDPLVCDDPTMFPGVSKACSVDADCAVVLHQTDCCGTLAAIGVEDGSVDAFNESYHVQGIHPQLMWYLHDLDIQIDCYGRHNRYLIPFGTWSPRVRRPPSI